MVFVVGPQPINLKLSSKVVIWDHPFPYLLTYIRLVLGSFGLCFVEAKQIYYVTWEFRCECPSSSPSCSFIVKIDLVLGQNSQLRGVHGKINQILHQANTLKARSLSAGGEHYLICHIVFAHANKSYLPNLWIWLSLLWATDIVSFKS